MSDWTGGYVVDVAYTEGVYREMTPPWLSLAAVLNGQPPLDTAREEFTYIELGCGNGLTSCLAAATTPAAAVWGFDFNPAHVERARRIAARCRLANCRFEEASFEELARRPDLGPTDADVIALHGVYSWITEENRRHVVEVIRQRLRPGGLVYISYSLTTGWSMMLPLQEAMRLHVAADRRRSDVAIRAAVATLTQLADDGARSFPLGPREQPIFDGLIAHDPPYVAHEYLGGAFGPMMFADVQDELAGAKCSFVGGASPADAILSMRTLPALEAEAWATPDVALRETMCDLASGRAFRADVFRRGLAAGHLGEQSKSIDELILVGTGQPFDAERQAEGAAAQARLDDARFEPIVSRLALGPLAVGELREMPQLDGAQDGDLLTTVALLVAAGYAVPGVHGWETSGAEASSRMNAVLIDMARRGEAHGFLVAAGGGTCVTLDPFTTLAVAELWDGAPLDETTLSDLVAERVSALGWGVSQVGGEDASPTRAVARAAINLVSGPFVHLGVVGPGASPLAASAPSAPSANDEAAPAEVPRAGPVGIVPGVSWVAVDTDIVVLDARDGVHLIDASGALIWPLLDGTATNDELAADVADVFGVPLERARDDVDRFVATMSGLGLVAARTP